MLSGWVVQRGFWYLIITRSHSHSHFALIEGQNCPLIYIPWCVPIDLDSVDEADPADGPDPGDGSCPRGRIQPRTPSRRQEALRQRSIGLCEPSSARNHSPSLHDLRWACAMQLLLVPSRILCQIHPLHAPWTLQSCSALDQVPPEDVCEFVKTCESGEKESERPLMISTPMR